MIKFFFFLWKIGKRCGKCGLQDSTVFCENGGTVLCDKNMDKSAPRCKCLPGFDPKTNCANRSCDGYCENGGSCMLRDNAFSCKCPAGYLGARCENVAQNCSSVNCLNGGMFVCFITSNKINTCFMKNKEPYIRLNSCKMLFQF
jgi:hypothetical protein